MIRWWFFLKKSKRVGCISLFLYCMKALGIYFLFFSNSSNNCQMMISQHLFRETNSREPVVQYDIPSRIENWFTSALHSIRFFSIRTVSTISVPSLLVRHFCLLFSKSPICSVSLASLSATFCAPTNWSALSSSEAVSWSLMYFLKILVCHQIVIVPQVLIIRLKFLQHFSEV